MKCIFPVIFLLFSVVTLGQMNIEELTKIFSLDVGSFMKFAEFNGYKVITNSYSNPHSDVAEVEYAKGVGSQRKTLGKYAHNAGGGVYYTTTIHSEFSLLKSQLIRRGYVLSRTYWISGTKHEDYDNKKGACPTANISILPRGPKTKYTVYTVGYSSESL